MIQPAPFPGGRDDFAMKEFALAECEFTESVPFRFVKRFSLVVFGVGGDIDSKHVLHGKPVLLKPVSMPSW